MGRPHKYADVIKAWADGARIQFRLGSDGAWEDVFAPTWNTACEYRVKPANVVRYCGVGRMSAGAIYVGQGVTSKGCATSCVDKHDNLAGVLRVEINPETLQLVSAILEKP